MSEFTPTGFIPFTSDYGFKVTFGNEKNTVFLKRALQALLQLPYVIIEITFSKTTFEGLLEDSRSGIYDMVCVDERGDTFIVEMQGQAKSFFLNRLQFYAFQRFDNLVKKGKFDFDIKEKIYCIAILGTNISEVLSYHNTITLKNQDGIEFSNQIEYITVELEKFNQSMNEVKTDLEKLIFTIKNAHKMVEASEKPKFWQEDWLNIPLGELDIRTLSPDRYEAYQYWLVHEAEAKRLEEELKAKGKIEGKIEEKILMIKELIKENLIPLSSIARIGRVSEEFVLKIKKELENDEHPI